MSKISDLDFSLKVVEAISHHQSFSTGANSPSLITGVDSNGIKDDYVVKFRGAERMSNEANMRELVAAIVALEMDIPTVVPVIVNISDAFIGIIGDSIAKSIAKKSLGLNFGSKYLSNYSIIPINQSINQSQLQHAINIFAFDLIIQNPDRRNEKPNMLTDGKEIVVFDHELAFGFVFDLFRNSKPWEFRENDMQWIKNHCLFQRIKGQLFNGKEFSEQLQRLDESFWNKVWDIIPPDWRCNQFEIIKAHFQVLIENRNALIFEIQKLLI